MTRPRSQGPLSTSRKYPGYSWSRVCYNLADSRDLIGGRGWKVKVCLHEACLLSPVGSGICNPPVVDRQNHSQCIDTFDIGVLMRSMFG